MKQLLIANAGTDKKMLGGIVLLAFAGLFFWFMYAAFRDGETSIGGEAGNWSAKKDTNPGVFYFMVAMHFFCGAILLWCFYKFVTHYYFN